MTEFRVSARGIYIDRRLKGDFSSWIKQRIRQLGLEEGKDYKLLWLRSRRGRPRLEVALTEAAGEALKAVAAIKHAHRRPGAIVELVRQPDGSFRKT